MTRRLTPLLEDPETEALVRDVLQAGREQDVAGYDYEAGLAKHMAVIAAGAPMPDWAKGLDAAGGSTTTAAATGAGAGAGVGSALGSAVTWIVVPVVAAAVIAAAMWARSPEPTPALPSGVQKVAPSASAPAHLEAAPQQTQAPEEAAPVEPEGVVPSETSEVVVTRHPRARAPKASSSTSKPRLAAAPQLGSGSATSTRSSGADLFANARPAASSAEPVAPAPSEQPVRQAPEREQATAEQPAPKAPARLDDARLEREMGMLAVAQRVLHSDPARTLLLVRQSAREFGDTMFAPERGQLELLALVKLGKLDDAKRLARPYLARYPNGPFSDRVRRALASGRAER